MQQQVEVLVCVGALVVVNLFLFHLQTNNRKRTISSQQLIICTRSLIWKPTYRHVTAHHVKSTRRSEFAAELDVIHILENQ